MLKYHLPIHQIIIQNYYSTSLKVKTWVSQGSVLGCLLFQSMVHWVYWPMEKNKKTQTWTEFYDQQRTYRKRRES